LESLKRKTGFKVEATFGVRLPDWHDALRLCLEEGG